MKGFELPLHEIGLMEFWREYRSDGNKDWTTISVCYEDYQEFCKIVQCGCVPLLTFVERMVEFGAIKVHEGDGGSNVYLLFPILDYWEAREDSYFPM